jgi:hypothetical protein
MNIISKHLDRNNLRVPVVACDTFCAFTGKHIKEGVELKHLIKDTFTDHSYIRFPTGMASVDVAMCIAEVIPNSKGNGFNALRSYSYFASEKELRFLARHEVLDLLLNLEEETPFYLVVSYSQKKHTSFKAKLNHFNKYVIVQTDVAEVHVNLLQVLEYLPTIQAWYTIATGKENNATPPTYFTKDDIKNGVSDFRKMEEYDFDKAIAENEFLKKYRGTLEFELIVHLLNKSTVCASK